VLVVEDNLLERKLAPGKARITFRTGWGSPNAFVQKVAGDFPRLRFEIHWELPDLAYQGDYGWENGGNSSHATADHLKK
jgi:hypothetical protein